MGANEISGMGHQNKVENKEAIVYANQMKGRVLPPPHTHFWPFICDRSCYVAWTILKLTLFLSPTPKDYRIQLPHPAWSF